LITSKADNLPNTVLESISCGTPVLGYKIGGIPDMINMTNGFLYDVVDELLAHLKKIKPFNETKREKIAVNAKKNFSNKKQVNSYIKLYNSLNS
jgi:glycosyltransferase involved in cell wall biosynthesis